MDSNGANENAASCSVCDQERAWLSSSQQTPRTAHSTHQGLKRILTKQLRWLPAVACTRPCLVDAGAQARSGTRSPDFSAS
jgi:hypothetical protein